MSDRLIFPESGDVERPQVFLGSGQALVAQQDLQRFDVEPRLQHLCREGVAPLVQGPFLAMGSLCTPPTAGRAMTAVQASFPGDLFAEFQMMFVRLIAAVPRTRRIRRGREDELQIAMGLLAGDEATDQRRRDRYGTLFVILRFEFVLWLAAHLQNSMMKIKRHPTSGC